MTEKQKYEQLKHIVGAIVAIKAQFEVEVIKDYEIPPLVNTNTKQDIGFGVKLQLNTRYDYNEEMLTQWKNMLKADEWYISVKRNQLHVTFNVRYKEPASEDSHIKKSQEIQHDPESCKENGNSLTCDDLERKAVGVGLRFRDELICDGVSREAAEIYAAIAQQKFMDGAKWQEEQFEKNRLASCNAQTSEELEKAAVEAYKKIVEKGGVSFLKIFKAGVQWKENQFMKDAIEGIVLFDYYGSDNLTYGCIEHDSFCLEDRGLKDKDKVKLIIIKEEQL